MPWSVVFGFCDDADVVNASLLAGFCPERSFDDASSRLMVVVALEPSILILGVVVPMVVRREVDERADVTDPG